MTTTERTTGERPTGELVGDLSREVGRLVRDELQLARLEVSGKARRAGVGVGMMGAAAVLLNMGSRRIVGFALGGHHDANLAAAALQMAIAVRGGKPGLGWAR